jgi:Tetratricopeptide repeat
MQGQRTEKCRSVWKLGHWGLGCLLLVFVCNVPQALAQFSSKGARSTIAGSVLIDGQAQPAAKVRVDVKALTGGELATTFTDATGRFEAPAEGTGSVIVAVQEQGYEPVEQRVDVGFAGRAPGVVITLHKLRTNPVDRQGYTVSVHSLKVPAKARRAFEKGMERLQKKDLEGSLKPFAEATNAFPDYYEAYYKIGLANLELRRDDEAEQALQKAIDLSGGRYAEAQFALGALLCERQAYPEAEEVLRRGIEVDANSWKGHLFLGQALFGQGRLAEAEKSAREVLLRRSDIPSVHILLANIHIRQHEYALGIKDLDTSLSMEPTGPSSDQARAVRDAAERVAPTSAHTVSPPQSDY